MVFTDQTSLKHLLQQRVASCDKKCWVSKLLGDFEVIYKPGPENKVTDSLSRIHEEGKCKVLILSLIWHQGKVVEQEATNDPDLKRTIAYLQADPTLRPVFSLHKGILLYKDRLVMSSSSAFIPLLL